MSGRVIESSSDDEGPPPTSTPYLSKHKKITMQLNEFDASIIAPDANYSKLNCTVVPKSQKISPALAYQRRQKAIILSSSDDDDDDDENQTKISNRSSTGTILGTPSSDKFETALSDGEPHHNKSQDKGSRPDMGTRSKYPDSSVVHLPQETKADDTVKQNKFQFRPLQHKTASSTAIASRNVPLNDDTIPLDDLANEVSQMKLDNAPAAKNVADLADSFSNVVQIDDEESSDDAPNERFPSPDIVILHHASAPRRIEPPVHIKKKSEEQLPRQMILLSEPPANVPVTIPVELRAGVGGLITKLQKTIAAIPKENDHLGSPERLKVDLYDHQTYGLTWMWWREQMEPYGGILADEMGLGKTVMVLALTCRGLAEFSKENSHRGPSSWTSSANSRLVPSRATLVICPPSVLGQWEDEISKKTNNLRVYIYHGPSRTKSAAVLSQHDIVLTTFNTVGSDIPKLSEQTAAACASPLIRVNWERIVLDEGHIIRNPKTCGSQAACRLIAKHRWIVTGTPVHNKPSDMYSLVKFLRLTPFDDPKVWDAWIGMKSVNRQNAERLNTVARALLLRRTKDEVMCGLQGTMQAIPSKTVVDVYVDLKPDEKEIYDHLNSFATKEFRDFLKSREQRTAELQRAANHFMAGRQNRVKASEEKSFSHIFVLILRLRQCSVLPHLIHTMIEDDDPDNVDEEFDPVEDLISMKNPVFSEEFQSAKLEKMYYDLHELKKKCRDAGVRMEKVVIVSQWTTLLRIVAKHLERMHYSFVTISGEVKISDRMDIMSKFNNSPGRPEIMLLSLAAGGVGLNLTGANNLFFLDIHWNPQMELQAQDRIHRFGQKKPVTIYRYITRGTMEERVVDLQKEKLALADGILNSAQKKNGGGLRLEEMRQLFGV